MEILTDGEGIQTDFRKRYDYLFEEIVCGMAGWGEEYFRNTIKSASDIVGRLAGSNMTPHQINTVLLTILYAHTRIQEKTAQNSGEGNPWRNNGHDSDPTQYETALSHIIELTACCQDELVRLFPEYSLSPLEYAGNDPKAPRNSLADETKKAWGISGAGNRPSAHTVYKGGGIVSEAPFEKTIGV